VRGVSSGANMADYLARKAGKLLDPVKVVAQVLICFLSSLEALPDIPRLNQ